MSVETGLSIAKAARERDIPRDVELAQAPLAFIDRKITNDKERLRG